MALLTSAVTRLFDYPAQAGFVIGLLVVVHLVLWRGRGFRDSWHRGMAALRLRGAD